MVTSAEKFTYIKIEYGEQIEAEALSNYIKGLSKEFKYYLKEKKLDDRYSDKLYIKEIKQGCLEIFPDLQLLVGACYPLIPYMEVAPVLFDYVKTIVSNIKLFETPDNLNINFNNNRINNYLNINLLGKSTNITYNYQNSNEETQCIEQPNGNAANLIEANIIQEKKKIENLTLGAKHVSVPFYWDTAKFSLNDTSNFKGKIESITPKALPVIWNSDNDKKYMTEESHFDKPWQELNYVVDVEIQQIRENYCYKILKVHKKQTFTT